MENAKNEFVEHVGTRFIKCAVIKTGVEYLPEECKQYFLPVGYSPALYQAFLEQLDFRYDNGYGSQELFGTIWYADGTWSSRGEYDGSEWWEHNVCPPVPEVLESAGATQEQTK